MDADQLADDFRDMTMDEARLAHIVDCARLDTSPAEFAAAGHDPIYESHYPIAEVAAAAIGLVGSAAAELHTRRGGRPQQVSVSVVDAARSLSSFKYVRLDGINPQSGAGNPTIGAYRCGDGAWVYLQGGFPHLRERILHVLGDPEPTADGVRAAASSWCAADLEDAVADARGCATRIRSWREWHAEDQGRVVAALPAVEIVRIGDGPRLECGVGSQPLSGIRVIDAARVLAGPTCTRTLTEHGADTLVIGAPDAANILRTVLDTGHGKRAAWIDLNRPGGRNELRTLLSTTDVFVDGYRSGALEARGFGPKELTDLRPGLVIVSVNCYGVGGPWRSRAGWEQNAEAATGVMQTEGTSDRPQVLPAPFADYVTGYLGAVGAIQALIRRAEEGGSWWVRASLCQTAEWLQRVGPLSEFDRPTGLGDVESCLLDRGSELGRLTYLPPVVQMSETPARYRSAPVALGSSRPRWTD